MWVTRLATFCPHVVPRKATKTTLFEILVFWEFGHRNTLFGGDRKVHRVKGGAFSVLGSSNMFNVGNNIIRPIIGRKFEIRINKYQKIRKFFFKNRFFRFFEISFKMILRVKYVFKHVKNTCGSSF